LKKNALRIAIMICISIVTGYLLLSAVYLIPSEAQRNNLKASASFLAEEKTYRREAYSRRRLDNFTDALMLLESGYQIYDNAFINAVRTPYYNAVSGEIKPHKTLTALLLEDNGEAQVIDYARYWHGYQIILRPLLLIMDYEQIRQLNTWILFTLIMLVAWAIAKRTHRCLIPFCLALLLMSPTAIVESLQYSTVTYVTLLTSLAVLGAPKDSVICKRIAIVFLCSGIAVAYFDLLTFPTVALTMPLVLLWGTVDNREHITRLMLKCTFCWAIGYAGMWMGKWGIALICDGRAFGDSLFNSIKSRSGTEWNGAESTRFQVLMLNFEELFLNPKLTISIACFSAISAIALFLKRDQATIQHAKARLALLIPTLIPMLWILVVSNHSWNHTWFTYRTLAPSIFSLLSLLSPFDSKPTIPEALQ